MELVNLKIRHRSFGVGTVTHHLGNYITVKFDDSGIEKKFVYPDSFEKYLTLEDGTVSDIILADLAVSNERKAKIIAEKNEENIRSMTHGIVIPGKEGAPETEDEEQTYKNSQDNE